MTDHVRLSRGEGIQEIRLVRPDKKNALTLAMYDALADAIEAGHDDPDVRVILFFGSHGAFTAGNDLQDFADAADTGSFGEPIVRFLRRLVTSRKPVVAAVDGPAVGIGTTMLLHCDLVYASEAAVFRAPFLDLGLLPEAASSLLAPRVMGYARAFELLCLGTSFDAGRAREAGLVNAVVPADRLESAARGAAFELARKPQAALLAARALLRGRPDEVLARIDDETAQFRAFLASPEAHAAFAAFLNRKETTKEGGAR